MADDLEFTQLLMRHNRDLLKYVLTLVPRRDDAEEVLQKAAVSIWEKFDEYDRTREFLPWAMRFAYFEVLNFRKEWSRRKMHFDPDVLAALRLAYVEVEPELENQRVALQKCLRHVDDDGILLLRRRYCDAKSIVDLASESGKTVKSLYRKLDRVREGVARCIERQLELSQR